MNESGMLVVRHLSFEYVEKPILSDIDFVLNSGELLHLRGENGVGKTTLLKLLVGLLRPRTGDISYAGQSIYQQLSTYQQQICYIGYQSGLTSALTVRENCQFSLQYANQSLSEILAYFKLTKLADVACGLLSAGQRRRVALSRLLMSTASLWVLDEPFTALDHDSIQALSICLQQHLCNGGQVILTSHQALPAAFSSYQEYHLRDLSL